MYSFQVKPKQKKGSDLFLCSISSDSGTLSPDELFHIEMINEIGLIERKQSGLGVNVIGFMHSKLDNVVCLVVLDRPDK